MEFYAERGKWNGVADLMRYEILLKEGGVVAPADSICTHPLDELFADGGRLYSVNTGEYEGKAEVRERDIGSMMPIIAAAAGHPFLETVVGALERKPKLHRSPVRATGNRLMQRMVRRHSPEIVIWPMHYFIPEHFNGWRYTGPDRTYAVHYWGTTRGTYAQGV